MRREEEELQRALAESAQMASPLAGYQRSQPPASSSSTKPLPHQPPSPVEQFFAPPGGSSSGPRLVRAIYDFEGGQSNDELPFVRGDVIRVVECVYQDWWRGELRGREGIFPANRVVSIVAFRRSPAPTLRSLISLELYTDIIVLTGGIRRTTFRHSRSINIPTQWLQPRSSLFHYERINEPSFGRSRS